VDGEQVYFLDAGGTVGRDADVNIGIAQYLSNLSATLAG